MDEQHLIAGLRRRDREAFETLVGEYAPALMRLALPHVPSRAVAEEVVQETWIGILTGIDRFEGRSSLRTWIFQILLNIARSEGEREMRILPFASLERRREEGRVDPPVEPDRLQGRPDATPGAWAQPPVEWGDPQHRLDSDELRGVMLAAIRALPPRQRDVIAIRVLQGVLAEEACNALSLSKTNQRVLLHRARSKVRTAIESHLEESGVTAIR